MLGAGFVEAKGDGSADRRKENGSMANKAKAERLHR